MKWAAKWLNDKLVERKITQKKSAISKDKEKELPNE